MNDPEHPDSDLHEQIRAIHEVVGSFFHMPLKEFEAGFLSNADPETQVAMWHSVTAAWIAYHEEHLDDKVLSDAEEKRLISALIAIAAGVHDASNLGVPVDVGQRLMECYDGLEDE